MKNDDNKEKKNWIKRNKILSTTENHDHMWNTILDLVKQKNSTDGTTQYSIFLAEYKCGSNETKFVRLMNKITSTDVTK